MWWSIVLGDTAAIRRPMVSAAQFEDLPVEIIIHIFSNLDFRAFDNMLRVARRFRAIIESYSSSILPSIVERDFSPVEGFFYVFQNVISPAKRVQDGAVSCNSGISCSLPFGLARHGFNSQEGKNGNGFPTSHQLKAILTGEVHSVLNYCRTIKRWEIEFQRLRFVDHPQHSRSLRPHELWRLRQALYIWWRFASHFHRSPPDNTFEARRCFLRQLSTTQLHEAVDMWETISSGVANEVCPSIDVVRQRSGSTLTVAEAARIAWGEQSENGHIVGTIMKLNPEDILHLLVYRHRYATKRSVIQFVKLRHPRIEESVESFGRALWDVQVEREHIHQRDRRWPKVAVFWGVTWVPCAYGGILDHIDAEAEGLRAVYDTDAGSVAGPISERRGYYRDAVVGAGARLERLLASS
ncbi:hypothetical protein VTK56DRAFT_2355 [Thermocarpiscus australiensis]